jgi:hypothetical protein
MDLGEDLAAGLRDVFDALVLRTVMENGTETETNQTLE